jgi:hypothetical protein
MHVNRVSTYAQYKCQMDHFKKVKKKLFSRFDRYRTESLVQADF